MNRSAYPLKLPRSVKVAAQRLAREDGVSLNQFIAAAVAEKVGSLQTAAEFLAQRAGKSRSRDMLRLLRRAPKAPPAADDVRPRSR